MTTLQSVEQRTIHKLYWRLLPFTFVLYFICYLDRINVGFAALTMNGDLGFNASIYALGASAFFWGYCIFEIPSNMVLEKVGARIWIARIMVTWGALAVATAFVTGITSFAIVRGLLGVAEAGFFPGIILYFTYWFPARYRGRVIGMFMMALPISVALGSPISTALLELNGFLGIAGWKWVFIGEGVPAVLLGIIVLAYLTDRPAEAQWLTAEEREWLVAEMQAERRAVDGVRVFTVLQALANPRTLALATLWFGTVTASLGLVLFIPQIVRDLGLSTMMVGFATAIPYVAGTIALVVWGYVSDRMQERRWNLFVACFVSTLGFALAGWLHGSLWALAGLSVATVGLYGLKGPFWPLPSMYLSGTAAAATIAAINSVGNLGGLIGPISVGWIKDRTGSFEAGLYVLAGWALLSAIVALVGVRESRAEPAPTLGLRVG